jgi:hypothetical protein
MLNIREVVRRLLKYAVLVVIVGFSAHSIPKQTLQTMEVVWIALIAGMVFSILDSVTPSIKIHVEKKTPSAE